MIEYSQQVVFDMMNFLAVVATNSKTTRLVPQATKREDVQFMTQNWTQNY